MCASFFLHLLWDAALREHRARDEDDDGPGGVRTEQIERLRHKAKRLKEFLEENNPTIGDTGKEIKSNVTDNESACMATSHGVIQGYNANALVDAKHQVIVHGEAFGNGQDCGNMGPMLEGAKRHAEAIGLGEDYLTGKVVTADSNCHSGRNLEACDAAEVDAYIPDTQFRRRDRRFASRDRYKRPAKIGERMRRERFTYDQATDTYTCPSGEKLRLSTRGHVVRNRIADQYCTRHTACRGCAQHQLCHRNPNATRKHLSVKTGYASETPSQRMRRKIDTPHGRRTYERRLAIVEPPFANIRYMKKMNRFTLRGRLKVTTQCMLYRIVHNIEKILHYAPAYGFG